MSHAVLSKHKSGDPNPNPMTKLKPQARGWIHRETAWLAHEFIMFCEEQSLGYVQATDEPRLILLAKQRFGMPRIRQHLRMRLKEAPPRTGGHSVILQATEAVEHDPTIWGGFQNNVKSRLEYRKQGMVVMSYKWFEEIEWEILEAISPASVPALVSSQPITKAKKKKRALLQSRRSSKPWLIGTAKNEFKSMDPTSRRPFRREAMDSSTTQWLDRAVGKIAADYLGAFEEGFRYSSSGHWNASLYSKMRMEYNPLNIREKLNGAAADADFAEEVRTHIPTIWAAFSNCVRSSIKESAEVRGLKWSACMEWRLLRALYSEFMRDTQMTKDDVNKSKVDSDLSDARLGDARGKFRRSRPRRFSRFGSLANNAGRNAILAARDQKEKIT